MAAPPSPRTRNSPDHRAPIAATAQSSLTPTLRPRPTSAPFMAQAGASRRSALHDPEDMVLLREKLNQIAVGRRDNQLDHLEDSSEDDELRRRERPGGRNSGGNFHLYLSGCDRPSTPPSSPQPRDVLRKQLRLKNNRHGSVFYTPQRSLSSDDNNSDSELLDGMCVDAIEISPLPGLRSTASSYSVLAKCPEGFRKRKSVHIEDKELGADGQPLVAPLKKVSSQINILTEATSGMSWDGNNQASDHEMDDAAINSAVSSPDDVTR